MPFPAEPLALISRPKLAVLRHVGVLLPDRRVAHCTPDRGEHISSVEEFAAGKDVKIERVIRVESQLSTLQRIATAIAAPTPYNLVTNNCESFANRSIGEQAESPQLIGAAILVGLAILVAFAPK